MRPADLQKIINLQAELNQAIAQYIPSIQNENLRRIMVNMIAQGNRNIRELSGYPPGVGKG